ncbi:MAG: cadmium-translocating P-type ATPase [Verrucomicrobiae bacterium]|nr:cadmium-translocating P-type ATPase [Verrucomicrobiae bacterium]
MEDNPAPDHDLIPIPTQDQPGVLHADLDAHDHALTIDFDPKIISDDGVRKVAEHLAPIGHQVYCKALLHLGGRASGAAEQKLERKAQQIEGIRRARATFLGGVMTITFNDAELSEKEMIERVRETGAAVKPYAAEPETKPANLGEWIRYWLSGDRLEAVCMVLTFIFMIAGLVTARLGVAWHDAFYAGAYLAGGYFGVRAGLQSLRQWTIDVDLLMILAALGAAVVDAPFEGAMLLFLFSLSNVLQAFAIDRTRKAIKSLMKLRPDKALARRDGATVLLPVEELVVGDVLVVRPGESIALDSVIIEGNSSIDQASLTGESMPVSKKVGDPVFAGTINQSGGLEVQVTKLAKDSTIEKLVRMVEEAQSEKADTQRFLDRAEQFYATGVIAFTLALIFVPIFILDQPFHDAFYRAMTVMVVASPCALIISTPASILSAIGGAARRGVLFKGGVHLERAATVKVVAFDKTGTLTEGKPRVTDMVVGKRVIDFQSTPAPAALELLALVGAVEKKSEHPLAEAIVTECRRHKVQLEECTAFQSISGKGASGLVDGRRIAVGNARYFAAHNVTIPDDFAARVATLQDEGKTCVIVGELNDAAGTATLLGAVAIADVLRADAVEVIAQLKADGIVRVVMLTGDNERVARAVAGQAGVDEFHADLLPEDKVRVIKELKSIGPVAMIGDGVNDAPALASATVGIAMGAAGTDVAMETADVVLMSDDLQNVRFALAISRRARRVIYQNLGFALTVIVVLVISALGFRLPLPLGVVGHEGSTVLVCLNGLRMLAFGRSKN